MVKDYSLAKIYKIESSHCDKIYIGSTCAPTLAKRMAKHRDDYRYYSNDGKKYIASFELLKYDDCKIILIEKYPCNDIDELRSREGYWQKLYWDECVNKRQEGRTKKQYRIDNADKLKEYGKEYYQENINKIKEKAKQYRQDNVDKIKEKNKQYRIDNVDKIKQYRQDNINKIKEKAKQYYQDNAVKIKENAKQYRIDNTDKIKDNSKKYRQVKSNCDVCGKEMLKYSILRHKKNIHKL